MAREASMLCTARARTTTACKQAAAHQKYDSLSYFDDGMTRLKARSRNQGLAQWFRVKSDASIVMRARILEDAHLFSNRDTDKAIEFQKGQDFVTDAA
jgi:hypothetical protein